MMELQTGLERVQVIRNGATPAAFVKQRIAQTAQELSRAGDVALHVELCNEALHKAAVLLYERDSDGAWANVDSVSERVLVPMPWGSSGWQKWGLRRWEATVLRSILIARSSATTQPRPALLGYNAECRTWHVDIGNYGTLALAQRFLAVEPIRLQDWRQHSERCLARIEQPSSSRRVGG